MSAIVALLLLLIVSPAFADEDAVDNTGDDGIVTEESEDSEDSEDEDEEEGEEEEPNLTSCENLRGLDRASCRVEIQLKKKGEWEEGAPYCKPGARQTSLQRAYCMITRNQQKKTDKGKKSKLSRAHQKARRYEYRSVIKLRRQEFRTEVKETRRQFKTDVKDARRGVSRTIDNRIDVRKAQRQERRERMNERMKELKSKRAKKEANKKITVREGREVRLRRARLMHEAADEEVTKQKSRATLRRERSRSSMEERRARVRAEVNSPRVRE